MKKLLLLALMLFGTSVKANPPPEPKSITELPPQVPSTEGKASIYIDWSKDPQQDSTVYMINRTAKPVDLVIAYGHIRLYWEAETKPQQWERAQIQMWDQCGTGIGKFQLPAGSWIKQQCQPLPDQATTKESLECRVRLRSYNTDFDVSSNTGKGFVEPSVIAKANCDLLAVQVATLDRLVDIVRGRDPINKIEARGLIGIGDVRHSALWELEDSRHDRQKVLNLLTEFSKESLELRELVAPTLKRLQK